MFIELRWAFGVLLLAFAAWIIILNWRIFWKARVRREQPAPSWIPVLGGLSAAVGLLTLPLASLSMLWWLPFLLDWGSIPGLCHALFSVATRSAPK